MIGMVVALLGRGYSPVSDVVLLPVDLAALLLILLALGHDRPPDASRARWTARGRGPIALEGDGANRHRRIRYSRARARGARAPGSLA
jgi:hypothetical protein